MSARVLVFINGSNPTKEDRALAEKHGTKAFRNATAHSEGNVEEHSYAVAIEEEWIPQGYRKEGEEDAPTPKEEELPPPSEEELPWKKSQPKKPLVSEGE